MKKKTNEKQSLISVICFFIKKHPFFSLVTVISSFLIQFTSGLFPAFIDKQLFGFFESKLDLPFGIWFIIILLTARFLLLLFGFITLVFSWLFRVKIRNVFIDRMLYSILLQPKKTNLNEGIGDTVFKFRQDPQQIAFLLTTDIPQFLTSALISIVTLAIMVSINVIFTIAAVVLIIINIAILRFFLPKIEAWREARLNAGARSSGFLTTSIQAIQEIKTNNKQKYFIKEYFNLNKAIEKSFVLEEVGNNAVESFFRLNHEFIIAFILIFVSFNVNSIAFSISNFAYFIGLSVSLSNFAHSISGFLVSIKQSDVSFKRMKSIYQTFEDKNTSLAAKGDMAVPATIESLNVKNLCVKYFQSGFTVMKTFEVYPNEYCIVTGNIGSGKSSIIKALLGLIEKTSGEIFLNGMLITNPEVVFKAPFAVYVSSSPQIFNKSLRENILLAIPSQDEKNISDQEILDVLKIVHLDKDVENMKDGLETKIGNITGGVSGGQMQRIGMARALIAKPALLVLDDCFSAIDELIADNIKNQISDLENLTVIELINKPSKMDKARVIYFNSDDCQVEREQG